MCPGPAKSFDPDLALAQARDLFWRRGYDGTAISDLEAELGIGRKSLYDTFGGKRALFLRALEQYTETVIEKICAGLADERNEPDPQERDQDQERSEDQAAVDQEPLEPVAAGVPHAAALRRRVARRASSSSASTITIRLIDIAEPKPSRSSSKNTRKTVKLKTSVAVPGPPWVSR
jgi:AcrR family transcriptional regulator